MHVNTQMHILHFYVLYDCAQQNEDIVGLKLPHVNKVLYFVVVVIVVLTIAVIIIIFVLLLLFLITILLLLLF